MRLVAIDVDGTLIDNKGYIPDENVKVIRELQKTGVEFIIVTGRNDMMVYDYIQELGIQQVVIGCNGGSIRDLASEQVLGVFPLADETLKSILDACAEMDCQPKLCSPTKVFLNKQDATAHRINSFYGSYAKALTKGAENETLDDLYSLIGRREPESSVIKVTVIETEEEKLLRVAARMKEIPNAFVCRSAAICADIMLKGVSKGAALKFWAKKRGIARKEILAIGDGENDIDMLKFAGYAVAMGNAQNEVKAIADYVTSTNVEAGVAHALKKIFRG